MSWQSILKNVEIEESKCCGQLQQRLIMAFANSPLIKLARYAEQNECDNVVQELEKILGKGESAILEYSNAPMHDEMIGQAYEYVKAMYDEFTDCNEDLTMLDYSKWR
tara:strand:- start:32 stop:355 length:324 start_codon:yes stop_codon:yes gene_type:complete